MLGLMLRDHCVTKGELRCLVGDVAHVSGHDGAVGGLGQCESFRLRHLLDRQVTQRDVASLGGELADEFSSHPARSSGDDCDLAPEALHPRMLAHGCTYTMCQTHRVRGCFTGDVAYETDILDDFAAQQRGPTYPDVVVEMGMLVEDRASHFCGDVVRWSAEGVTLQDRNDYVRHFTWKPGGFLIEGTPVTLVRPATAKAATQRITASGSVAGDGRARVAAASRIWVEGKHDAELLEHVWGDDLRELGIVVEPLHGADDLAAAVADFGPSADRRLGVLLDHLVPGSKETRIAEMVRDPNVLITGHPFVDVWAGIRPKVLGLDEWPDVPKGDVPWKEGMCAALGVPFDGFWPRLRNKVNTFADLRPELVGAVEQLIDFVAE